MDNQEETLQDYFRESEKEFLAIYEAFMAQYLTGKIRKDEDGIKFFQLLKGMKKDLLSKAVKAKQIEEKAEKERVKRAENHLHDCPKCNQQVKAKVVGKATNKVGFEVFRYECQNCHKKFGDSMPIKMDEQMQWMRIYLEKLSEVKEGKTVAEHLGIDLEKTRQDIKVMEKHVNKAHKAEEKAEQLNAQFDAGLKRLNEGLSRTYGNMFSGKEELKN